MSAVDLEWYLEYNNRQWIHLTDSLVNSGYSARFYQPVGRYGRAAGRSSDATGRPQLPLLPIQKGDADMAIQEERLATDFNTVSVLAPDGTLVGPAPDLTPDQIREMYGLMLKLRTFDQRCLNLQRQGRMGTFAPFSGQEACQVGSTYGLEPQDWLFPTYRDHGAMHVHGVPLVNILRYYMGDEAGNAAPEGVNVFPISIPIATQNLHATGAAWAARLRGDPVVTVAYFGDGGTSPGDFHEALNFAAVFETPTIFFNQNNRYAISVPVRRQTRSATIAQKALAYGMPGVQVDGQDLFAVHQVMSEAAERARSGGGPTLIEALTYRFGPHTTSDDPKRYRSEKEVNEWTQERDPLARVRRYMEREGLWTAGWEEELLSGIKEEVSAAVKAAEEMGRPPVEDMFNHLYSEIPQHLEDQKKYLIKRLARHGEQKSHG